VSPVGSIRRSDSNSPGVRRIGPSCARAGGMILVAVAGDERRRFSDATPDSFQRHCPLTCPLEPAPEQQRCQEHNHDSQPERHGVNLAHANVSKGDGLSQAGRTSSWRIFIRSVPTMRCNI
jgi:hypothetical protein